VLPISEETLLRLATTSGAVSVLIVLIRSITGYFSERQRLQAFLTVSGRSLGDAVRYVEGLCQITSESPSAAGRPEVSPSEGVSPA
jgi:hypothetical protein